jgi:hypothetical protein
VTGLCVAPSAWAPACSECSDWRDQDRDGLVDLEDGDCADQADQLEGRLTRQFAAELTKRVIRNDLYPASRTDVRCRRAARLRCRFSLRERATSPTRGCWQSGLVPRVGRKAMSCASGMRGSADAAVVSAKRFRSRSASATCIAPRPGDASSAGTQAASGSTPSPARCQRLRPRLVASTDGVASLYPE